ncbi:52 kDa repressor of the inhibitor of the protein kinase-like [Hydra vulgaris]|uniref:52 kDa repressor of the inhibitor of the protein kinase-like n=1 Tax=Hydra vulgaris TaxID=6087 RepID=UPI0032EA3873
MDHNNNCRLHQMSMHCLNILQSRSNSKKNLIEVDIDNQIKKLIISNRNKLIPIIKTIIFLGRNDIAFRGHRDDSKYHPEIGETCKNNIGIGNFVELLNFRIEAGDKVLEHHIRSAPKIATYISKTTQNELIECCGKTIEEVLINKIKNSGYFSILCDGASDCSNVEQLSLVIRYIDCDNVICEDFLRFIECKSGTTGLSLAQNIVSAIDDLGLDIQKCRGQGYDGAGAMSGKLKGISSRIKFINSKAIFVHYACHKLNLVASKSCNVQSVRNVLDQIKDISYFFNLSPKRASCLNKFIFPGQAKLINTCRTRWVQKLKGLDVFFDNYISVFHSMEEMAYNEGKSYNIDTSSKASCFLNLMTNFSFIVSLVLTIQIMDYFYAITVVLQTKAFGISQQCNEINCLKTQILDFKKNIDFYHNEWYLITLDLAKTVDVSEVKPRLCGRQVYRDNYPSDTVSDYFKYSITSPLLDHLINELEDRFDEGDIFVYKGLSGIPTTVVKKNKEKCFWKLDFMEFLHFYISDMPHPTSIHAELDLWETFWNNQSVIPSTITETLKSIDMRGFPNIREGFLIMGTIPITTCECERSISVIRRLKTFMRSHMTESRFNSLALMSIHQEIIPDVERVLNIFSVLGERRLLYN